MRPLTSVAVNPVHVSGIPRSPASRGEPVHADLGVGAEQVGHELHEAAPASGEHVEQRLELGVVGKP